VSDDPPLIAMSLWEKEYTHALIDETGEFTVNIPSSKLLKQVWLAGTRSGSKMDKAKLLKVSFTTSSTIKVPGIEECIGTLECRVKDRMKFGVRYYMSLKSKEHVLKKACSKKVYRVVKQNPCFILPAKPSQYPGRLIKRQTLSFFPFPLTIILFASYPEIVQKFSNRICIARSLRKINIRKSPVPRA
jgi:hypothetical protein